MAGNGDLIPLPVSYEEREGSFCVAGSSSIVAPPELFREAEVVAGWLSSVEGIGKVSAMRERRRGAPAPGTPARITTLPFVSVSCRTRNVVWLCPRPTSSRLHRPASRSEEPTLRGLCVARRVCGSLCWRRGREWGRRW